MSAIKQRIKELIQLEFEGTEYFLVDIVESTKEEHRIQIFVDCLTGLPIHRCAKLSRYLEHHLEEEGLVGEKYWLEVSSPGVGNPYKVREQYQKGKGRWVEVLLVDGTKEQGILTEISELEITLMPKPKKQKNKHRKRNKKGGESITTKQEVDPTIISFINIKQTKEKIIF